MENIVIRKAIPEDVQEVYRFVCELEGLIFDPVLFQQHYLQHIANKDYYYLVAEADDELLGFISCHGQFLLHHMAMVYEIQELYVDKDYRHKGVGKLLLEHLQTLLAANDYDMLEVAAGMQRVQAHEFYRRNGFSQSHYKFTKKGKASD